MLEQQLYDSTIKITPWATQTNAKRSKPIIEETMPLFITRAKGTKMINSQGREYIDFFVPADLLYLVMQTTRLMKQSRRKLTKDFCTALHQ